MSYSNMGVSKALPQIKNHNESNVLMESSLTERATWRDYYELCKPNVVWLMILTAIVGMCMATPVSYRLMS